MNRQQKSLIVNLIIVISITTAFVFLMINVRYVLNRSESKLAMQQLGQDALEYRKQTGALPSEFYLNGLKEELEGSARLGELQYRAQWIILGAEPDTILAYVQKDYRSLFVDNGYVVLRLDGTVEWMEKDAFEKLLAQQQSQTEIKMLHQQLKQDF